MKRTTKHKSKHDISRQAAIVFAVLTLIMTTVFSYTFFANSPITKTAAKEKVAVYNHYAVEYGPKLRRSVNTLNYIELFFENEEKEYIRGACVNKELIKDIEALEKGTKLHMMINPDNNYIIELKTNSDELLNFDYAQKKLQQEGVGFLCIGIFMLVLCGYFVYKAITTKERITKADIKFYWDIMRRK